MPNQSSPIPAIVEGVNAIRKINEYFDAGGTAMTGGRNAAGITGPLKFALFGGRKDGVNGVNTEVTLTSSTTNYIVWKKSDAVISTSTSTTNWNNSTDYYRLYSVVTGSTTVTNYTDERLSAEGIFGGSGGGGGSVSSVNGQTGAVVLEAADIDYDNATSGLTATDVQGAIDELAAAGPGGAPVQSIIIACSDETTDLTTGTAKVTFRMPYAFTLLSGAAGVRASLSGAPSGSVLTVDINEGGSTILSTKLTIDAGEKTSTTAATPAVISDTSLADDAEITIDIDGVGSSAAGKGLKVTLIGTKT